MSLSIITRERPKQFYTVFKIDGLCVINIVVYHTYTGNIVINDWRRCRLNCICIFFVGNKKRIAF